MLGKRVCLPTKDFKGQIYEDEQKGKVQSRVNMTDALLYLTTPSALFKVLELVSIVDLKLMVSVVLGLNRGTLVMFSDAEEAQYFSQGLVVTALIVTPLILLSHICGRNGIRITIFEMVFNLLMFFGFLAIGAVTVNYWLQQNQSTGSGFALGSLCLLASLIYLLDIVLAFLGYHKK